MSTSIDDLLTVLDDRTASQLNSARDATRALHHLSRLLTRMEADGFGRNKPPFCHAAVRHLADACAQVAVTFDGEPGPISDLVGVLHDAVATLYRELSEADRWAITARLTPTARRCAAAIVSSGPYQSVPQLHAVTDRCTELLQAAAVAPPRLSDLGGLDAPIPSGLPGHGRSPAAEIAEAVDVLVAEFRRRDREPATLRELIAVSHVASRVAGSRFGSNAGEAWRAARDALRLYTDGIPLPPPGQPRSAILLAAMRIEAAVRRAHPDMDKNPTAEVPAGVGGHLDDTRATGRQLRRLADACDRELTRIRPTLCVSRGPRPLTNDRVDEWLHKKPFRAQPPDLLPPLTALLRAGELSSPVTRPTLAIEL